ncbi:MAG: YgjP-like metallopeptidase domain-containing protein [Candidatus Enteromonas sp.]
MAELKRNKTLLINNEPYKVKITFRKRNGMTLRLSAKEEKTFLVSASTSYYYKDDYIDKFLIKAAPKLLSKVSKKAERKGSFYQNGYLYVLGELKFVGKLDDEQLKDKLKEIGLPYLKERTRFWAKKMHVHKEFAVKMRYMKTRFGVNCLGTKRIFYTNLAICYAPEIVDYLIIHELAHFSYANHQAGFYRLVSKYDPDYARHQRALRKGDYRGLDL